MTDLRFTPASAAFRTLPKTGPAVDVAPTCQWLDGEARERRFCGAPSEPGRSWCADHLRRVYAPRASAEVPA